MRAVLNLGHTVGHALEVVEGYGTLSHGAAVALGLQVALAVSEDCFGLDPSGARASARDCAGLLVLPRGGDCRPWSDSSARPAATRRCGLVHPGSWA